MSETKITTANIRIALSHQYSTFEISAQLENPEGVTTKDIENARQVVQALANDALNEYKRTPNQNPTEELKRIEKKLEEIKKLTGNSDEVVDPKEVAAIQSLPAYTEIKKAKK